MTATRTVTPNVVRASRALQVTMYLQIAFATVGVLTSDKNVTRVSLALLLVTSAGLYSCREWRKKWERTSKLDEREQELFMRAKARALRTMQAIFGPVTLILGGALVSERWTGEIRLGLLEVVCLLWGMSVVVESLPTLLLISGERLAPEDDEPVAQAHQSPATQGS